MVQEPKIEPVSSDSKTMELIQKEIRKLSWRQQKAFVLMAIEERDSNEAGELMGCSPATARVHLGRARENLRITLKRLGIDNEA
jgi:DNA-directed RNA polymerase specialized sigma24 family protein